MRALLALVCAAACALPPPALLVLRAACEARDPAALAPPALLRLQRRAPRPLRLLSYQETCGPEWSAAVTRAGLRALSDGEAVAVVGWPGAAACDALSHAARVLRAPRPTVCALGAARAAAVVRLAARLGWRRATLPPAPPRSECRAAQQAVARALAAAGVTTAAPARADYASSSRVSVVILCASRARGVADAAAAAGAGSLLLLQVEENEAGDVAPEGEEARSSLAHASGASSLRSTKKLKFHDQPSIRLRVRFRRANGSNSTHTKDAGAIAAPGRRRPDYLFPGIDASLPRGAPLLLGDEVLEGAGASHDLERVYTDALEAVDRVTLAETSRLERASFVFRVYRRPEGVSAEWKLVGTVAATANRALDDAGEWTTEAVESDSFEGLGGPQSDDGKRGGAGAGVAALSAGAGVTLAAAAALVLRWGAARRRRRRRGGDAVLAAADFSFPADEHCVGEGMEAMLSCWLQQLHEFGGPRLSRPDLLTPRPPSAPSSTCSVNRTALDRRIRYKGDPVHVKPWGAAVAGGALDLKRKTIDVLLVMQVLRHENLNPFIGCLCEARPALVWDHCGRGSLEDVLMADDIKLDWTFRLSLLTDLVRGMRHLHASPLRVHGRLTSRNCVVDSRWVLRVTDFGLPALARAQVLSATPRSARDLLWTAPELLRDPAVAMRGTQLADVYSFAIVMQEVIVRGEPYCMLSLTPEEIVEKLSRPPPLIRPSVSMSAAPPEAVNLMRQCWSEAPDLRPDFSRLHDLFRHLHRGRKINIVDSMFEMLEKYSNNLEELIKDRTEQLDMEKKKTEQLLNRMLPRSVAERLLLGSRVEPEEFADVSIYFSDIVGFTALAARSTPVQVVDLLNDLYTTFDAAIERYNVYKVETIGDAYMVVGGLPQRSRDHAASVATMALHLLHLAGRFRVRHLPDTPLHLRIGLHSGPCCAAVVGLTMPRYCLFGDTVNTASRMESTGAAWRVQVSAATAERLAAAGGFRLRSRGLVMIKGKGAMHTYWLLGKEGFDRPLPTPPPLESEEVLFEADGENESETSSGPPSASVAPPDNSLVAKNGPDILVPVTEAGEPSNARGWWRSGAASADSSPPGAGVGARYRRGAGGGPRTLRRQWSLERGEVLATAAAGDGPLRATSPLALAAAPRAPAPRYRTRPAP